MASHLINLDDVPELEGLIQRPGAASDPALLASGRKATRYLGRPGDDPVSPQHPPFVFHIRRPKGDVTADHAHTANRIEFLIEGRIEWRERGKAPVEYGAGTLSYVEAGTVYGYEVLEDATILLIFEKSPGMNYA
jgi:quercetin dioxygenase-like cupin family protein